MLKVVATAFEQIVTELNGAEPEQDTTMTIIKIVLK
jgi:hypothetical protein